MSALTDDELAPRLVGSTDTVPEFLAGLGVADEPAEVQRRAVRRAIELPGVGPLTEHLLGSVSVWRLCRPDRSPHE